MYAHNNVLMEGKMMVHFGKCWKYIFQVVLSLLPCASPAQDDTFIIDQTLLQLNLSRADCLEDFLLAQTVSGSDYLVVIPEITALESEASYTLRGHVLLVEIESGRILARNNEPPTWYSDAFYLYKVEVLDNPLVFGVGVQNYGLSISYSVNSKPNPYDTSLLSVWVRQGENLKEIVTEFPLRVSSGETNAANAGEFEVHSRTLSVLPEAGKDWYDLQVIDSLLRFDYDWEISSEERILEQSVSTDTLHFQPATGKYTWE